LAPCAVFACVSAALAFASSEGAGNFAVAAPAIQNAASANNMFFIVFFP
jgi:hypothetical protein